MIRKFLHLLPIALLTLLVGILPAAAAEGPDHEDRRPDHARASTDQELNDHPSGKDRTEEPGNSGTQGNSPSDPDGDSNGGADKPGGDGGFDDDKDGNNGCGNDDDFEDDNNGNCGGPDRDTQPDENVENENVENGNVENGNVENVENEDTVGNGDGEGEQVLSESLTASDDSVEGQPAPVADDADDAQVAAAAADSSEAGVDALALTGGSIAFLAALALLTLGGGSLLTRRTQR